MIDKLPGRERSPPNRAWTDASAHLPARVRQLLEELLGICRTRLDLMLHTVLGELEQQLFELAGQAHNTAEQELCLESLRKVNKDGARVPALFVAQMESQLSRLRRRSRGGAADAAPLSLLDAEELDESVALNEMASRAEVRNSALLFELGYRMAALGAAPLYDPERLPLGPRALGQALREAIVVLDLPVAHRVLIYRIFEHRALVTLGELYRAINTHLVNQHILPHLRVHLPRRSTAPSPARIQGMQDTEKAPPDAAATAPAPPPTSAAAAPQPASTAESELLARLGELLQQRRISHGESEPPTDTRTASASELQAALSALQSSRRLAADPVGDTLERLHHDLLDELTHLSPDGQSPHLTRQHRDVLELTSMLFDRIGEEIHASDDAQGLLARLRVPILRVALNDSGFFTERSHPARRLLNTVAETAAVWGSGEGEGRDSLLAERMRLLVDRVDEEFDGDVHVFETLLEQLNEHMDLLARRAQISERRHIEAAKGRDRLEDARRLARELIAERLSGQRVSSLVRTLLEEAWTDVLALTVLRQGPESEIFRQRVTAAEQLIGGTDTAQAEPLSELIEKGLAEVGLHDQDARRMARRVLNQPTQEPDAEQVTQTELAMQLKTRQRLGKPPESGPPAAKAAQRPTLQPNEKKILERLKTLPFGTWFEFVINQQGEHVRRKLAWYSPMSGRCLFVNMRGARCDDRGLEQLACDIARGQAREAVTEQAPVLDRAWNAIVATLRQFGGRSGTDVAGEST